MYKHFFKRLFDFCIALLVIMCIGWFLIIVAVWLHFANKSTGAFFIQERPGKDGKIFKVIKFKTMTDEIGVDGMPLHDDLRLTKIGRFVRSTSLDELPQLLNILKGDMALIGPRPLATVYLKLYSKEQARRHEVRPGITGWAQVNGRNNCKFSKKFEMDVWYVDHCTLFTDIKVLWMTVKNVLKRKDIGEGACDMLQIDDLGWTPRVIELLKEEINVKRNRK